MESEIQKQGALKTNSKTRFNAIKRIQKTNEKFGKVNLLGYGLKDNKYFGDNIAFNYNYIKNAIDILGNKDIEIYSSKDKQMLIFENNDNERAVVLACKVY